MNTDVTASHGIENESWMKRSKWDRRVVREMFKRSNPRCFPWIENESWMKRSKWDGSTHWQDLSEEMVIAHWAEFYHALLRFIDFPLGDLIRHPDWFARTGLPTRR